MNRTYCKVIVASDNYDRYVRTDSKYPNHNQNISSMEDLIMMFCTLMKYEKKVDCGLPMDTIIVVNGTDTFLDRYNGTKTKNGTIYVVHRENIGGAFGGYNFAYNNYEYDFYLFTEDDLILTKDGYYKDLVKKWDDDTGFIALVGISSDGVHPIHCHGGVGLTRHNVLKRLENEKKELPYAKVGWNSLENREDIIKLGEIPFTNKIHKMGLKLSYFGNHSWDNDYLIPYYNLTHYNAI